MDKYKVGRRYTRTEIRDIENDPGTQGKWVQGYLEHNGEIFIFSNFGGNLIQELITEIVGSIKIKELLIGMV